MRRLNHFRGFVVHWLPPQGPRGLAFGAVDDGQVAKVVVGGEYQMGKVLNQGTADSSLLEEVHVLFWSVRAVFFARVSPAINNPTLTLSLLLLFGLMGFRSLITDHVL